MKEAICSVYELRDKRTIGFDKGGISGFVVMVNDKLFGYVNRCPHIGTTLEFAKDKFLDADGRFIQCSMHGALFEIPTGLCIHGPCLGEVLEPISLRQVDDWIICDAISS